MQSVFKNTKKLAENKGILLQRVVTHQNFENFDCKLGGLFHITTDNSGENK